MGKPQFHPGTSMLEFHSYPLCLSEMSKNKLLTLFLVGRAFKHKFLYLPEILIKSPTLKHIFLKKINKADLHEPGIVHIKWQDHFLD